MFIFMVYAFAAIFVAFIYIVFFKLAEWAIITLFHYSITGWQFLAGMILLTIIWFLFRR